MKRNLRSLYDTLKLKVKGFYITHVLIPLAYRWTSKLRILSDFDSIQYVLYHHCSVSRYGDGEFGILRGIGNGFQTSNSALAKRLAEILDMWIWSTNGLLRAWMSVALLKENLFRKLRVEAIILWNVMTQNIWSR